MRYRYIAYGLVIDSEIELPELGGPAETDRKVDLVVRYGDVTNWGTKGGGKKNGTRWVDPSHFWFHVEDVGHYLICNGNEIVVMRDADADPIAVRLYLLGSACGVLLLQRRMLVLHGNAIRLEGGCMVCVGESGAGKSTLAAGFIQRGFDVIADDVVPVDLEGRAIPGFPRIKLWQDAADHLGVSTKEMIRIYPGMDKYNLPMTQSDPFHFLPIRWMYVLTNSEDVDDIRIEPISGLARFGVLRDNSYHYEYLNGNDMVANHLEQCSRLSNRIRLCKVTRPSKGFTLDRLIEGLLEDLASVGETVTSG